MRQGLCNDTVSVWLSVCLSVCVSVRPSVCPSVCPILRRSHGVRRICCWGLCRQTISIDCCTAHLQQARPPFDPYPEQHGAQQQMRAVSRLQRRRKLETDSLFLFSNKFSQLIGQPESVWWNVKYDRYIVTNVIYDLWDWNFVRVTSPLLSRYLYHLSFCVQ